MSVDPGIGTVGRPRASVRVHIRTRASALGSARRLVGSGGLGLGLAGMALWTARGRKAEA